MLSDSKSKAFRDLVKFSKAGRTVTESSVISKIIHLAYKKVFKSVVKYYRTKCYSYIMADVEIYFSLSLMQLTKSF